MKMMRGMFAIAMLIACGRLLMGFNTPPSDYVESGRQLKTSIHEEWLDGVDEIFNRPRLHADPSRAFFDRIMAEVMRADYEAAAAGFQLFLALHPTSPLSTQADYWLGECLFRMERDHEAIQAFQRVLARAPLNPQLAAAAFIRQASSYARLGQTHRSRRVLELLTVRFPTATR